MAVTGSPIKQAGEARTLKSTSETKAGVRTGFFLARYVDLDGKTRQAGRFVRKGDANAESVKKVTELNAFKRTPGAGLTLVEWQDTWPKRVRLDERTIKTNTHRINKYIVPYLPEDGEVPLTAITRPMLFDVQAELLAAGLAKGTIDGAFSSLSAVLGYALGEERIEFNVAHKMRVNPDDPLLNPTGEEKPRRYIPPDEFSSFLEAVPLQHRGVCLASLATGCRTQELFAMERADHDKHRQLILIHQRAKVTGGDPESEGTLRPGLKTTRGVRRLSKEQRGRITLYPAFLYSAAPPRLHRRLIFPAPRGGVWGQRNFYRDVWEKASTLAGTEFGLYDLRHTFVSHLLASGIPTVEVASYAGHSTRELGDLDNTTTRVYQHPTGEYREAAIEAITAYVNQLGINVLRTG
jgi:integrase